MGYGETLVVVVVVDVCMVGCDIECNHGQDRRKIAVSIDEVTF